MHAHYTLDMPRKILQIILGITIIGGVALFYLLSTDETPLREFVPAVLDREPPVSKFYEFDTPSSFVISSEPVTNRFKEDLCESFPHDLLREIQPVLKTGHGVIDTRVQNTLDSCSACLDNLLILSDFDEELPNGQAVIDVIGDLSPKHLEHKQLAPYKALNGLPVHNKVLDSSISRKQAQKLDKFKFLSGISRAWRMRPDRRWYVFYEGDTFIVWDNVFRFLENFDPDTPHYFGSPTPGKPDHGQATWFGNGGPGYILSRAAMKRLVKDDWNQDTGVYLGSKLTDKYWKVLLGDCCGDSILGWALWKAGVSLEGIWPSMNPHPLHGIPFSDLYWCQPVFSLHKTQEKDMIDLWRWEWTNRQRHRPLLYRDLAMSFLDMTNMTTRRDWDNADWDAFPPPVEGDPHASSESCELACQAHDECFQWTYHLQKCWLVRSFRLGSAKEPQIDKEQKDEKWSREDQTFIAGWDTTKIQQWIEERPCDVVEWVRPSTERIF